MNLIKSGLWNGTAVAVRLLSLLVANKVLAVVIGPAGYAVIAQFNGIVAIVMAFATGGILNGIVKYTAERHDAPDRQNDLWATALKILLVAAGAVGLVLLIVGRWLSERVLADPSLRYAFYWLSASLIFFAANSMLLAVLNGLNELRRYVQASIASSLIGLVAIVWLALNFGVLGVLISVAVTQSVSFFFTLYVCRNQDWLATAVWSRRFNRPDAWRLAGFSAMAVTSALCLPLTQTLIRDHLAAAFGWAAAGEWQGVFKVSEMYVMVITSTLSVYYLPRLSRIRDDREIRQEIINVGRLVLPITCLGAVACYALRDMLIEVLFSREFSGMRDLFFWQLAGDVFRIASWLVGFVFQARALAGRFILAEIAYAAAFYFLVQILTPSYGLEGAAMAYAISYAAYGIWAVVSLRRFLFP